MNGVLADRVVDHVDAVATGQAAHFGLEVTLRYRMV
jgi:hypothetical protein